MSKQKTPIILHGECKVAKRESLPTSCVAKEVKGEYLIVADSETTGNHHVVETAPAVSFFEDEAGTTFMVNTAPAVIKCVHENRHDNVEIPIGTWEFGTQMEYDYFSQELRTVRD